MQEDETSGISIREIFKTIGTQKWLALALAVLITLAGILILNVGYDPNKRVYVSTFSVNLQEKSGNIIYPGDNTRNYRDFVSKSNLTAVKQSDEENFASVDVDGLYKSSAISIYANKNDDDVTYTIKARAKAFKDRGVAEKFIVAIAETPSREILELVSALGDEIDHGFNERLGNENKILYLNSKLAEISSRFSTLAGISTYAKDRVAEVSDKLTTISGVLHEKYYETDKRALEGYVYTVKELERELEIAQTVLKNLKGLSVDSSSQGVTVVVDSAQIATWSAKAVTLEQQIKDYNKYLEKYGSPESGYDFTDIEETEATKAFSESLTAALNDVKSLINLEYQYYQNTSLVSFDGATVSVQGEIGLVKGVLISLILGVVIALVAAYIVGRVMINRKAKKEGAVTDSGTDGQVEAGQVEQEVPAEQPEDKEEQEKPE